MVTLNCRIKFIASFIFLVGVPGFLCAEWSDFFDGFKRSPSSVGSVIPTSQYAAREIASICKNGAHEPRVMLEVGAGTGPITEQIVTHLRAGDTLYIVEAEKAFAQVLRSKLPLWQQQCPDAHMAIFEGTLEEFERKVGSEILGKGFTQIISSLPFNSLPFPVVNHCITFVERYIKRGGVWTWIEYPFLGWVTETVSFGDSYCRIKTIRKFMQDIRDRYHATSTTVVRNFPPVTIYRIYFPTV